MQPRHNIRHMREVQQCLAQLLEICQRQTANLRLKYRVLCPKTPPELTQHQHQGFLVLALLNPFLHPTRHNLHNLLPFSGLHTGQPGIKLHLFLGIQPQSGVAYEKRTMG